MVRNRLLFPVRQISIIVFACGVFEVVHWFRGKEELTNRISRLQHSTTWMPQRCYTYPDCQNNESYWCHQIWSLCHFRCKLLNVTACGAWTSQRKTVLRHWLQYRCIHRHGDSPVTNFISYSTYLEGLPCSWEDCSLPDNGDGSDPHLWAVLSQLKAITSNVRVTAMTPIYRLFRLFRIPFPAQRMVTALQLTPFIGYSIYLEGRRMRVMAMTSINLFWATMNR